MRTGCVPETDSLDFDLAERPGIDTREIGDGIVVDIDGQSRPVGFDIDQASRHLDIRRLDLKRISFEVEPVSG